MELISNRLDAHLRRKTEPLELLQIGMRIVTRLEDRKVPRLDEVADIIVVRRLVGSLPRGY
jgi:hypothetical protein